MTMKRMLALLMALCLVFSACAIAEDIEEVAVEQVSEYANETVEAEIDEVVDEEIAEVQANEEIEEAIEEPAVDEQYYLAGEFEYGSITMGVGEEVHCYANMTIYDGDTYDNEKYVYFKEKGTLNITYYDYEDYFSMYLTGRKTGTTTLYLLNNSAALKYPYKTPAKKYTMDTMKVTVKKAPKSIKMSTHKATVTYGKTKKLTAKVNSGAASFYKNWYSDDESVAVVDSKGVVSAVGVGVATIYVETYNGKWDYCVVTVPNKADNMCGSKPTTSEVKALGYGWKLRLKSVHIVNPDKVVCEIYVMNNVFNAKSLRDMDLEVYIDGELLASKYITKSKISVKKGKVGTWKVTFKNSEVYSPVYSIDMTKWSNASLSYYGAIASR